MTVDPYASGVLQPDIHARLVADLANFAKDACIQQRYIYEPLPPLSEVEMNYLRHFRQIKANGDVAGLIYSLPSQNPDERFPAICGALVRNFIRARVMTLGMVLDALASKSMPDLTCILIPNFYSPFNESGHIGAWQISALYDFLMQRHVDGNQTLIHVSQPKMMAKDYGTPFERFVAQHFIAVEG